MKQTKNRSRKLALRPETVAVLTPRQLTQIVSGDGTSSSCETRAPCPWEEQDGVG